MGDRITTHMESSRTDVPFYEEQKVGESSKSTIVAVARVRRMKKPDCSMDLNTKFLVFLVAPGKSLRVEEHAGAFAQLV